MSKTDHPVTPAVRFLRQHKIEFVPHLYPYEERGGTAHSAHCLNVDEHAVVKTIVLQNEAKKGLIVLMHGDKQISTRKLGRLLGMKHIEPADPQQANKWTGYLVGGTSPFGCKTALPVYMERSIAAGQNLHQRRQTRFFGRNLPDCLKRAGGGSRGCGGRLIENKLIENKQRPSESLVWLPNRAFRRPLPLSSRPFARYAAD